LYDREKLKKKGKMMFYNLVLLSTIAISISALAFLQSNYPADSVSFGLMFVIVFIGSFFIGDKLARV
jgi:hypothetical protein